MIGFPRYEDIANVTLAIVCRVPGQIFDSTVPGNQLSGQLQDLLLEESFGCLSYSLNFKAGPE
jgi:hypothetical protein